jgi:hypothetical protein
MVDLVEYRNNDEYPNQNETAPPQPLKPDGRQLQIHSEKRYQRGEQEKGVVGSAELLPFREPDLGIAVAQTV